jgi:hypothetical protein
MIRVPIEVDSWFRPGYRPAFAALGSLEEISFGSDSAGVLERDKWPI